MHHHEVDSTTIRYTAMDFDTDIHGVQEMIPTDFDP